MNFDLGKIVHEMGPFALAIAAVLILMAIASLAVVVERLWTYQKYRELSRRFSAIARDLLERGDYDRLIESARGYNASPLANLLSTGMKTYLNATSKVALQLTPIELTKRELARGTEAIQVRVRRGLSVLASVGSVAPFVGLLGTVVGIITAFEGIAKEGSGGLGVVSAGIAEALVETALGLVVAIPAVLAFNYLTTRSDGILLALEQAKGEFVDHLESHATPTKVTLSQPQREPHAAVRSSVDSKGSAPHASIAEAEISAA